MGSGVLCYNIALGWVLGLVGRASTLQFFCDLKFRKKSARQVGSLIPELLERQRL